MTKRTMAEVREKRLRFIEPVVNRQVVFWLAAEFSRAALRMLKWVSHGYTSQLVVV